MHNTNENQIDHGADANQDDRTQTPPRRPNVDIRSTLVTVPRYGLVPTSMWSQEELDGDELWDHVESENTDDDINNVSSVEGVAMVTDSEEEGDIDSVVTVEDDDYRFTRNFPR
ncbi:MAG: hypothetical protein VYC40_01555 [Pseudomonadota bacterium]|nr:hypothetical protein [Pseudomonadota bacterium]